MINKFRKIAVVLVFSFFTLGTHAQISAYSSGNNYDVDASFSSVGYTGNAMRILQQRHDNNLLIVNKLVIRINKLDDKISARYKERNIDFTDSQIKYFNSYVEYENWLYKNVNFSDNNQVSQVINVLQGVKKELKNWLVLASKNATTVANTKTSTTEVEKRVLFSAMDLFKYKPVNRLKGFNNEQIKSFINNGIDDDMWKQFLINAWSECRKSNTNEVYDMYTFYYGEISKSGFDLYCKELLILMQMDGVIKIN